MKFIKNNFIGALEIALFMPKGTERFNTCKSEMMKSFMIPVMTLPLMLAMLLMAHPSQNLSDGSMGVLAIIYSLRLAIYLAGFFAFAYIMAKTLDKMDELKSFITANNWLSAPIAALSIIPILMSATGLYPQDQVYTIIVMLTLYSCACTAFMAAQLMRMPYELAIFVAITGLCIHQHALGFVKWAATSTLNFLA